MAYLHDFLITMHEIDAVGEVYLETFQLCINELFCKNGERFKEKRSVMDNCLGSKYALQRQR